MTNSPLEAHSLNVDETPIRASSSGGPDRFGLDKTKGLNDLCRRDARVRAEKEAAALDEFSRRFESCTLEEQYSLAAQRHFALQEAKFGSGKHNLCRQCWIMNKDCICRHAKRVAPSQFQHRLVVYMHFKEYSRSSNTGALPQVCLDGSNISVFVKGIPSHDSQVMQICSEPNTFVFFPSSHSITTSELLKIASERFHNAESSSFSHVLRSPHDPCASRFNIIIVDGTWTQAKKVARCIPEYIPHVRLMSTGHLAFKAPMRTQTKPDRICTLGAIIQLLSEMDCDPFVVQSLSELLMLKAHVICEGKGLKSNLEHANVDAVAHERPDTIVDD